MFKYEGILILNNTLSWFKYFSSVQYMFSINATAKNYFDTQNVKTQKCILTLVTLILVYLFTYTFVYTFIYDLRVLVSSFS